MPAAAARAEPTMKVKEMMLSVGMPTSEAFSCECDTARMARPSFVFRTIHSSTTMRKMETAKTTTCWLVTEIWPDCKSVALGMISGTRAAWPRKPPGPGFPGTRNAHGSDEKVQPGHVAQGPVGQPLDEVAQQGRNQHGGQQHEDEVQKGGMIGSMKRGRGKQPGIGSHHDDVAVREIDEPEDPYTRV